MKINLKYIRYVLFFISFLIFVSAIQVFVKNFNINKTIKEIYKKQNSLSWETLWLKIYNKPFLNSKYATYFFQHKQSIVLDDEKLIKIKEEYDIKKDKKILENTYIKQYTDSAKDNWLKFFKNLQTLFVNNW